MQRDYGVIIEPNSDGAFMPEHPLDILKAGKQNKVPIIIGYTDKEGILSYYWGEKRKGGFKLFQDFEETVPYTFGAKKGSDLSKTVGKRIKDFYFHGKDPSMDRIDEFYDVSS